MSALNAVTVPPTPVPERYRLESEILIPPGEARAVRLRASQVVQLIDVRGQQVSDMMAWRLAEPAEVFSPAHTISCLKRLVPHEDEHLYSNHRRPLMRIRRDTVGRHDLIVPCCDPERYLLDYGLANHGSCLQSIRHALGEARETWDPRGELAMNVFMNNRLEADGSIVTEEPPHQTGDYIELEALDALGLVASSCPQDLSPCNAWKITEMAFRIYEPIA